MANAFSKGRPVDPLVVMAKERDLPLAQQLADALVVDTGVIQGITPLNFPAIGNDVRRGVV